MNTPSPEIVRERARRFLNEHLLEFIDLRRADPAQLRGPELRGKVVQLVRQCLEKMGKEHRLAEDQALVAEIVDEAVGLGPIERYLRDPGITEIMVNGPGTIYVERNGRLERTNLSFTSLSALHTAIERIVSPLGRRVDESSPMVDARLSDGSRVNVVIPPISVLGPVITIRKFSREPITASRLVELDTLSSSAERFLRLAVRMKKNIVIAGGTGSGKTTLLNALAEFIPSGDRVVTIEDAAELRLPQEHVITMEARPPNLEGEGEITIRDLLKNALRMRPDRIIVGECRGGEAIDMLQAMNTGHDGSLTTVHANSTRDALLRIETMTLMAGFDLPLRAIREQMASAIDLVVFQARLADGARKVTQICEICGTEESVILMHELFRRKDPSLPLATTGRPPAFAETLSASDRNEVLEAVGCGDFHE